ncbi:PaREP1 family protein [Saccharolobus islandicus]|uniref:Archaeal PaREP1/PaREP8 family n=1 Tax=Saccharolobus islandicus (strain REY15A) TaxID=930945 RepID=F0NGY5_SACI5|nr:PaREP1 family protein [Sulfolobus islandicus]ADX84553.1 archaeal PaREP1/PaREP8 family [Sulfolobus islandicus REY15A]
MEKADWIIAIMSNNKLREIVAIIGDKELRFITEIALDLHEFQYNGFDKDVEISRYSKEEFVKKDIMLVIEFIKSRLSHIVT